MGDLVDNAGATEGPQNCTRIAPDDVGWDKILPQSEGALDKLFQSFRDLGLADASLTGAEQRAWIVDKYRERFVLNGGGCSRRVKVGVHKDADFSFHVTCRDPDGSTRNFCGSTYSIRDWMLKCLKGTCRPPTSSWVKRKYLESGGGEPGAEQVRKARQTADGGRATSSNGGSRGDGAAVQTGGDGRGGEGDGMVSGRAEDLQAQEQKQKAVQRVRVGPAFVDDVAHASDFGMKPEIIEVGASSLFAALQKQCQVRGLGLENRNVMQDAAACRKAVAVWLRDTQNHSKVFASLKSYRKTAAGLSGASGGQSLELQANAGFFQHASGADALNALAEKLLDSETFLGHPIHLFALAHLLDCSTAILVGGRRGRAKEPWVIWNAAKIFNAGTKTGKVRLYISRHGENFGSLEDLPKPWWVQAENPSDEEGGGEEEMGGGEEMEQDAVDAADPLARNESSVSFGELPSLPCDDAHATTPALSALRPELQAPAF